MSTRHRHHARVDDADNFLLLRIPHHNQALDGMSAALLEAPSLGTGHTLQPAALLLRSAEIARRVAAAAHGVEISDAPFPHGGLPIRISLYLLLDAFGLVRDQNRFDSFDFLP